MDTKYIRTKYPTLYNAIKVRKLGHLFDEACIQQKLYGYWTFERCRLQGLKYKSRSEWQQKSRGSYSKSRAEGWLNNFCIHMKRSNKEIIKEYNRLNVIIPNNQGKKNAVSRRSIIASVLDISVSQLAKILRENQESN